MALNFRTRPKEEPEINLVPFIDVLLVIIIFLMLATTFSRFRELQVTLPSANAQPLQQRAREIVLMVAADGRYAVNGSPVEGRSVELLAAALVQAAAGNDKPTLIISADAAAAHQSVINVMDAARRAGLNQLTFATQAGSTGAAP